MNLKQRNNTTSLFGIGAVVLVVVLLMVLFLQGEKEYDWEENYKPNTEQPYDNDLIYKLLEARATEDSFIRMKKALVKELKPSEITGTASYVYIGSSAYYTYEDVDTLLAFVSKGHDAFISSNEVNYYLESALSLSWCDADEDGEIYEEVTSVFEDSAIGLNLNHPTLKLPKPITYQYKPRNTAELYRWAHFDFKRWCGGEANIAKLGTAGSGCNFIRLKHGEGYLYLHTTPIAFTNFYMRDSAKLAYAQNVFSHLPDGSIYWDEGSRTYHYEGYEDGKSNPFGQSELKYILSQPASKWAFYTLLSGVLLYIVFYMKRRQRIIPVIEPYPNTSVEYVLTIGGLYFMKQEHRKLAEQQFKLFLSYVRNRYRLSTQQLDDALIKRLAATSKVEEARVRQIFSAYQSLAQHHEMSKEQLIVFNKYLEYFYQNCK